MHCIRNGGSHDRWRDRWRWEDERLEAFVLLYDFSIMFDHHMLGGSLLSLKILVLRSDLSEL